MPTSRDASHEVVVLGGGPAGASAASLLSLWGHDVVLITRATPPTPHLAESIPPSARGLLDRVGVLSRVDAEGFWTNGGNTVWWANGRERSEPFSEGASGFHAERGRLERVFHDHARAAGVRIVLGGVRRATRHDIPDDGQAGPNRRPSEDAPWAIEARSDGTGERHELTARWVLDATGRAGAIAKPALRRPDASTSTLAIVRRWRTGPGAPRPAHTLVESYRDGWAWSVPLSASERCVTAMVDPRLSGLERGSSLDRLYAGEIAKTKQLSRLLAGAEPVGRSWACPASLYTASVFGGPGFLLVGDAASFIDPLSSYGVKKALASAWLAAVTAHTALVDPELEVDARSFHDRRERDVYRSYRRLSAPFFREAALAYAHAFWERRAEAVASAEGETPVSDPAERLTTLGDDGLLPGREAVEGAWESLRSRDRLEAAPGATLRVVRRPALDGNRIVLADHLANDAWPHGARWVQGVPLPDLVRIAPEHATVPDLFEACARSQPGLPLPAFLTALATAFAAGFLEWDD
jgi:flavin-dependent dehydrogenase